MIGLRAPQQKFRGSGAPGTPPLGPWSWINNPGPDHTKKCTGMSWKRYDLISALKFIHIPSPYFWCSIMCTSSLVCTQTFSVSQKIVERAKKNISHGIWPRTQGGGGWVDLRRNKNKTSVDRLRVIRLREFLAGQAPWHHSRTVVWEDVSPNPGGGGGGICYQRSARIWQFN